jgi:hypothetical protein
MEKLEDIAILIQRYFCVYLRNIHLKIAHSRYTHTLSVLSSKVLYVAKSPHFIFSFFHFSFYFSFFHFIFFIFALMP